MAVAKKKASKKDEGKMADVVNMSWNRIEKALDDPDVPPAERRKIALEVAKKSLPKEFKHEAGDSFTDVIKSLYNRRKRKKKTLLPEE